MIWRICMLIAIVTANSALVEAGTGRGTVAQLIVSHSGHTVFVEVVNGTITSFPCASTHPNGFRYGFRTDVPGGKEMLAALMTAKATGAEVMVVGKGTCASNPMIEDVDYLWLY